MNKWIRIFTFIPKDEIETLIVEHEKEASQRLLQKRLAKEITVFVHGADEYHKAMETTEKLFANQSAPAESLNEEDLEQMEGIVKFNFAADKIEQGIDTVSFLAESGIFPSKGEARKMVQSGGIMINRKKVEDFQMIIDNSFLLHQKYLLIQKGKRNYFLVKAV